MKTHLAIYHPKHAGILSPILHLKANQVILLHRKEDNTEGIQSVFRARGISCQTVAVTFETQIFRQQLEQLLKDRVEPVYLNASFSYHKWVMLCFEYFIYNGWPIYMVDKFTNQLTWLHDDSCHDDEPLSCQMKVHEYLKAFNTQVLRSGQSTPEPNPSRDLTRWIIDHIGIHDKAITKLNYMAMMANSHHQFTMRHEDFQNDPLQVLLDHFSEAGMLKINGKKVNFIDDSKRFYCNGGWLENHVFALLFGMRKQRPNLKDVSKGLEIVRQHGQVKNEIDVVAMANNRLHIIECKTKKFGQSERATQAANSVIYRLDTLKQLTGGLSGRAMLISYQAINKHTYQRAKDLGIHICANTQLKQLEHHLFRFIDQFD